MAMDYNTICNQTCELAKETGELIRKEREKLTEKGVETKGKNDFVTLVDKASEEHIVQGLLKILPGSGFITEEGTASQDNEPYIWIIDPIDGTTNFIHGAPPYSISIALQHLGELVVGVIYEITADECFYAFKGGAAYLNGKKISVSSTDKLSGSLLATGFPYTEFGRMQAFMKTLDFFFHNSHGVRRLGSAAVDLAYVACGRYEGFYEYNLNAWDVAAGILIVTMAGGKVSDFKGGNNFLFGKELIASNTEIFEEFKDAVGGIMNEQ
jgi:myo-inositol-1(or 4)-monophosphatase